MLCPKCNQAFDTRFCPNCGYSPETEAAAATVHTPPATGKPSIKVGCLIAILVVVGVFVLIVLIGSLAGSSSTTNTISSASSPVSMSSSLASSAAAQPEAAPFEAEFSSGHYTAGIDFPAGKYDLFAVSGGGNVSSSNMFDGGINAMLGDEATNQKSGGKLYEQKYQNVKLPEGTVLSVNGLTLKISTKSASTAPLTPRSQAITEVVKLGSGNYLAGEDFPEGTYDLAAVSGGGNVSSSNMFDGGINAVLGDEQSMKAMGGGFYVQEYKNIVLEKGVELKVNGLTVSLTPSK